MIEIHSDDYGFFPNQSKRILDCVENGALNSVSIMPNSPYLHECMEYLEGKGVLYAIHLNFVLGKRLSHTKDEELISKNGVLNCSFSKLLIASYIPFVRKKYFNELKSEIDAQIDNTRRYFVDSLRIDSHRHYHMIPVVFDALVASLDEQELPVSFIRIPKENLSRYIRLRKQTDKVRLLNIIKVSVLNVLSLRNTIKYKKLLSSIPQKTYAGVMFSGNMNIKNSLPILKDAINHNENIEIALHPGGVFELQDLEEIGETEEIAFQSDSNRNLEAKTIKELKQYIS